MPAEPNHFNLAIESLVRLALSLSLYGKNLSFLAYGDDLVLMAKNQVMQEMLYNVSMASHGLNLGPTKCATGNPTAGSRKFYLPLSLFWEKHPSVRGWGRT